MTSRMKEDEKNEKIIRGLLKLPANRRCINCNNLGPQYVCTNFWTFICTNCSGVHRDFTHRVKSVSMAKFTSQEVTALQEGGNERAREIYFKEWDPQRNSFPDNSNIDKLRDFIKQVYVNRRYTGDRNADRTQRMKGDSEYYHENRRSEPYQGGSSSPPYEEPYPKSDSRNDDRSLRFNYGGRSPGYHQSNPKGSPTRFQVVDDRRRDDTFGGQVRKFEGYRSPDVPNSEMRIPNQPKMIDPPSLPMIRPVRDILGDDVPKLQVGDPSKANGTKLPDNSAQTKITSPLSSMDSSDGNSAQFKSAGSFIDFSEPEHAVAAAPQQPVAQQTSPASANGGDWASFHVVTQTKVPQVAANASPLEPALAGVSAPVPPPAGSMPHLPISSYPRASGGGQLHMMQHQSPPTFLVGNNISNNQSSNVSSVGASNNQSVLPPTSQLQGPLPVQVVGPAGNLPPLATKLPHGMTEGLHLQPSSADGVRSQSSSAESKSSGRKELPVDLFTALYQAAPVPNPIWQRGPYPVMGYGMQYPTGMAMPTVPQSSISVNPFDIRSDSNTQFPSMTSLQGALPNMSTPAAIQRSSSFGIPPLQWVPPQQFSPSPYMVQQIPSSIPQQMPSNMMQMGYPGVVGPGSGAVFGASGIGQNSAARFSLPNTPNSYASGGGNPFG